MSGCGKCTNESKYSGATHSGRLSSIALEAKTVPATPANKYAIQYLPTALAKEVMQSPPSVRLSIRPSVCFHYIFGTK